MGIDIQKQLDIRPYNDQNVVSKPVAAAQTKPQEVDEEKSNAAKWMVGLTATAAIVIGGLYAAKKGHLGKDAEKFAKRIFGENVKDTKAATSTPSTNTKPSTESKPDVAPALALITPMFVRGKIKNPKFKFNDLVQELQKANIKFDQREATELIPKTHITTWGDDARYIFRFDKEGTLTSIRKAVSDHEGIVYKFKNNVLSKIERRVPTENGKHLKHITEFAENGIMKAKKVDLDDTLRNLPINNKALNHFKTEEIVEAYIPRTNKYFKQAVEEFQVVSRHAKNFGDSNTITVDKVMKQFQDAERNPKLFYLNEHSYQSLSESIEKYASEGRTFNAEILKLVQKDMGDTKHLHFDTVKEMFENYARKLKIRNITRPENVATVGKPLKDCSSKEFIELLGEIAPEKIYDFENATKNQNNEVVQKEFMKIITSITGRSDIDEHKAVINLL